MLNSKLLLEKPLMVREHASIIKAYVVMGVGGLEAKCLYCLYKGSKFYSPENGFQICEISLNSVVKGHI